MVSAAVLALCLGAALFAPWVAPHNPFDLATLNLLDALSPPQGMAGAKAGYLLGTDDQGRDVLSAIMFGARISLLVGLASVIFAMVLGVSLGLIAGYVGGKLDAFIMRIADVQLSFPAILIALLIDGVARAVLPRDAQGPVALFVLIFAIGISNWVQYARTVRGSTLVEKNKEYVQAARVIGIRPFGIMRHHLLPNVHGTGARARHDQHRDRDHHRSDVVVSRRRRAAHAAVAGYADTHRQRFPVLRRMVDHHLSRERRW